jgi:hypothetical protein
MFRSSSLLRSLFGAALILAARGLPAQEAPPRSAMRVLAAEECQPSPEHGIPAKARAALERLKNQMGPWLLGRLQAQGDRSPAEVEGILAEELEALASDTPNPEDSFWHPLDFQVEAPAAHPDLLTVTATFGTDATLLVFRRNESGWKLLFQDRASAYEDIDGLFGDYTMVLTPKEADGSFFIAAARITPWYQSAWRGAELRVFRVDRRGEVRRIGVRKESTYLGNDDGLALEAPEAHHLIFRVRSGSSDSGRHDFPRMIHLNLSASGLHRIPPFAETPLDLVDEWLCLPWKEASILVEPSAFARLKPLHAHLTDPENNDLSFAEEVRQSSDADLWEVEADLERGETIETYRFQIGKTSDGLRLLDIQRQKS